MPAVSDLGSVSIPDVTPDLLPLLEFFHGPAIISAPPNRRPQATWLELRQVGLPLEKRWRHLQTADLWAAHAAGLLVWRTGIASPRSPNLLLLKHELARRLSSPCHLCELHCGALRAEGQIGACGSGNLTRMTRPTMLVGEEFGRGITFTPTGCNTRCNFCNNAPAISARFGRIVAATQIRGWLRRSAQQGANHQNWIGGNPDQHVPFLFDVLSLSRTPLPIVWTANGAASTEGMALLEGVVGAYVISIKFGNDDCPTRCGAPLLRFSICARTVSQALRQGVPVVVRVLALPGHLSCCARPVMEWLAGLDAPNLMVNLLRHQYQPSYRARRDPELGRVLTQDEREVLDRWAQELDLVRLDSEVVPEAHPGK